MECVLHGPSSNLPAGQDLCDLSIDLDKQVLHLSISDRRDLYHQLWVTRARAVTNTLGPGLPSECVKETDAYRLFIMNDAKKRYVRERHGDQLGLPEKSGVDTSLLWACFNGVLQGDHAGVEIATDAHSHLLQEYSLLQDDVRLVANKPSRDPNLVEGLVIDDFFRVSLDPKGAKPESSGSYASYSKAQQAYSDYDLLGSPEKDRKEKAKQLGHISTAALRLSFMDFVLLAPLLLRGFLSPR